MYTCFIIADDLTGANGTGVLLAEKQLRIITIFEKKKLKHNLDYDGVVYSSDTRSTSKNDAYAAVSEILNTIDIKNVQNFGKRIDSTLRGNIGSEIEAFLDVLGNEVIACVVPCYPKLGRIVKDGIMYVNGVILEKTEAASDALNPITTSKVEDIIQNQTSFPIKTFVRDDLEQGIDYLIKMIKISVQNKTRIFIFDGDSAEDISLVAEAVTKSNIKLISVDPGPFSVEVINRKQCKHNKVLSIVGTTNPIAKKQLERLISKQDVFSVEVSVKKIIEDENSRNEELGRIVSLITQNLKSCTKYCIYLDSIFPEKRNDLNAIAKIKNVSVPYLVEIINSLLGEAAFQIFEFG